MEQSLNQYKVFYETALSGNISRASEKLYISQPAISKNIAKLEENLGVDLFIRSPRGVKLTIEGEVLFEQLKIAFDAIIIGEQKLKKINDLGISKLRIGTSATLSKYILLPILKEFIKINPHMKITIFCQPTSHTLKMLEKNEIDVALVAKPQNHNSTEFLEVAEIEDIFVATKTYIDNLYVREGGYMKENGVADESIFKGANIMLLDKENLTRRYVDDYLKSNNIEIDGMLEVTNMDLLIEFAKIGLGVACVVKEFVVEDLSLENLIEIKLKNPINKRAVGIAFDKKALPTASINSFINFVSNRCID